MRKGLISIISFVFLLTGCSAVNPIEEQRNISEESRVNDISEEDTNVDVSCEDTTIDMEDIVFADEDVVFSIINKPAVESGRINGFAITVEGKVYFCFGDYGYEDIYTCNENGGYELNNDFDDAKPLFVIEKEVIRQYIDKLKNVDVCNDSVQNSNNTANVTMNKIFYGRKPDKDKKEELVEIYRYANEMLEPIDPDAIELKNWLDKVYEEAVKETEVQFARKYCAREAIPAYQDNKDIPVENVIYEKDDVVFVIAKRTEMFDLFTYGYLISAGGKVIPFQIDDCDLYTEEIRADFGKILDVENTEPIMEIEEAVMNKYIDTFKNIDENNEPEINGNFYDALYETVLIYGRKVDSNKNVEYETIYVHADNFIRPTDPNAKEIMDWLVELDKSLTKVTVD